MSIKSYAKKKITQYKEYEKEELARRKSRKKKIKDKFDDFYEDREESYKRNIKKIRKRIPGAIRRFPRASGFGQNPNRSLREFGASPMFKPTMSKKKFVVRKKKRKGGRR